MIFWVVSGVKGQKMPQNDKKLSQTSYLRNHTSYDCHIWYTYVKWIFIFSKFLFSRSLGGKRAKNGPKLENKVHKCKMIMSPVVLFIFSKFWVFWIVGRVKMTKTSVCCGFISQEPYIIWSVFMVHICKRIISPSFFYIFSKC